MFFFCSQLRIGAPQYVLSPFTPMLSPFTEHVSVHGKKLLENMARASGVANNTNPLSWREQMEKVPKNFELKFEYKSRCFVNKV